MIILGIDSSSLSASASVVADGKVLSEFYIKNGLTHSATLMTLIDESLEQSKHNLEDIDLIAVVNGPGSFTGIRIGVACAKGLAFKFDTKCVGISTLESLAYNIPFVNGYICPVMDARCSQVYTAVFKSDGNEIKRICEDKAVCIDSLAQELNQLDEKVYLLGDGAHLLSDKVKNSVTVSENIKYQHSSSAAFAAEKLNEYFAPESLQPVYLRLPQAERELKNKKLK